MSFQIILNLIVAFNWMLLNDEWNLANFIIGYLLGLAFIIALRRFLPQEFYLQQVWQILKLLNLFGKELILSSITMIGYILRPRMNFRPGIVAFQTELNSDWEITILACLITLTPGTLTLEISPDQRTLYIHAIDIHDAELLAQQIKGTFEKAIMEVTR
jgi:multicomponent Na+:H+ antiporter subunit E